MATATNPAQAKIEHKSKNLVAKLEVVRDMGQEYVVLNYGTERPKHAECVFTSDNVSFLQVGPTELMSNGFCARLTPGSPGTVKLSAQQSHAYAADDETEIPDPDPVVLEIIPIQQTQIAP